MFSLKIFYSVCHYGMHVFWQPSEKPQILFKNIPVAALASTRLRPLIALSTKYALLLFWSDAGACCNDLSQCIVCRTGNWVQRKKQSKGDNKISFYLEHSFSTGPKSYHYVCGVRFLLNTIWGKNSMGNDLKEGVNCTKLLLNGEGIHLRQAMPLAISTYKLSTSRAF